MINSPVSKLVSSIVICLLPGLAGAFYTVENIPTWYAELAKPSFNPPNWIFSPVWTTLYILMGIALFLIWKKGLQETKAKAAFWFFIAHLVVNFFWTFVFFSSKNLALAFGVIIILWLMITTAIYLFWKIDRRASLLLLPYLAWVSFASLLNYSIWQLN
jgi:tryptophan-rich sensory protein